MAYEYNSNWQGQFTICERNGLVYDSQLEFHFVSSLFYSNDLHEDIQAHSLVIKDNNAAAKNNGQYSVDFHYSQPQGLMLIEVKGRPEFHNFETMKKVFRNQVQKRGPRSKVSNFALVTPKAIVVGDKDHYVFPTDSDAADNQEHLVRDGGVFHCPECGKSYIAAVEDGVCPWCGSDGEFVTSEVNKKGRELFVACCATPEQMTQTDWEARQRDNFLKRSSELGLGAERNDNKTTGKGLVIADEHCAGGYHKPSVTYAERKYGVWSIGTAFPVTTVVEFFEDVSGWKRSVVNSEMRFVDDGTLERLIVVSKAGGFQVYEKAHKKAKKGTWNKACFYKCPEGHIHIGPERDDHTCPTCLRDAEPIKPARS